jgi:thioredoxin-related protein
MLKLFFIIICFLSVGSADDIEMDAIIDKAKKSHKPVLIFLHKPDCGYCEKMIEFTLADEEIEPMIKNNFIFVDVDIGDSGKVAFKKFKGTKREYAQYLGYDYYPCSIFLDEEAKIVYVEPGAKEKDIFLKVLRFVKSRSYVDGWIEDFK